MDEYSLGFDPHDPGFEQRTSINVKDFAATRAHPPSPDKCRSCGLCVAHCPTYKINAQENQSPRGRIRLIHRVLHDGAALSDEEAVALHQSMHTVSRMRKGVPFKNGIRGAV